MATQTLSPKEMAELIGASESSLKRWIDSGKLEAHKTSGGHRRIAIPEAVDFIRRNDLPVERPDLLGIRLDPDLVGLAVEADKKTIFEKYLLDGRFEEAFSLVLSEYLSGAKVFEICDNLFHPALKWIGGIWEHDDYGIVIEHRATDFCIRILNQLRIFIPIPTSRIQGLGGSPRGDTYTLPSLCVATTLESEGIPVNNLGANVPFNSFIQAVERIEPSFVWLSISHIEGLEDFDREFSDYCHALDNRSIPLIVGGHGLDRIELPARPNIRTGQSMAELLSIVRDLPTS